MGNQLSSADVGVDPPAAKTSVSFKLNGKTMVVGGASPLLSLNDWLRLQPGLAGTKRMCEEGGCGCCVVAVTTGASELCLYLPGGDDDDSWECVLPQQTFTIAINSVRNEMLVSDRL